ncbi:MAG TPA: homocitrate synthase [Candidatus Thermoplasmatota archaeon]|nr:homocitrate synthase [Candidatus Thermoplasmatota archaeon]
MTQPEILDTTLREGEQTPGVYFRLEDKLQIARKLDEFGVDFIEAGHPRVSEEIRQAVDQIAKLGLEANILAHSRAVEADIDAARQCDADWVGIFFSVRDKRLEDQFRKNIDQAVDLVSNVVSYAKAHGLKVRYTPEDTVRSPWESVVRVARAAEAAGADRISVADTVGIMTPTRMFNFFTRLRQQVKIPINVHCHNDLGMAVANSLSAYEAGAALIDVTVNGLGERTGIADIAPVTTALATQYGQMNRWKLDLLPELSSMVEDACGMPVSPQYPIVGENAFRHNAGLHVAAVMMNPDHYESIPAHLVGRTRSIVVDRFAGLPTLEYKCRELNVQATPGQLEAILRQIKAEERAIVADVEFLEMLQRERAAVARQP